MEWIYRVSMQSVLLIWWYISLICELCEYMSEDKFTTTYIERIGSIFESCTNTEELYYKTMMCRMLQM